MASIEYGATIRAESRGFFFSHFVNATATDAVWRPRPRQVPSHKFEIQIWKLLIFLLVITARYPTKRPKHVSLSLSLCVCAIICVGFNKFCCSSCNNQSREKDCAKREASLIQLEGKNDRPLQLRACVQSYTVTLISFLTFKNEV